MTSSAVAAAVAEAHRREWGYVLAATVRLTRDIDLAEECVQDAYAQALRTWADRGIPAKPAAWLTTAARNRALDVMRRDSTWKRLMPMVVEDDVVDEPSFDDGRDPRRPATADLHLLPPRLGARCPDRPHACGCCAA